MKIPRKKERLKFFQDLFEEAKGKSEVFLDELEKHYKQYKGDKAIDGSTEEASLVRNITYELIESQVTSYLPTCKVEPLRVSDKNERNAKSIETLAQKIKNANPFERMNDFDERYTYIYGGSVWLVEWDESITSHNTVGDIKVTCISPKHFIGQPGIYEIQDMEYCFVTFETSKEEIVRKYGVEWTVAEETESDEHTDDNTATLYVCYYKNEEDKICKYVWSNETELSDIDDYYSRKREYCISCGKRKQLCECENPSYEIRNEEYETLQRPIKTSYGEINPQCEKIENGVVVTEEKEVPMLDEQGNQVMQLLPNGITLPVTQKIAVPVYEQTKLPFYSPKLFPIVIRKNTSREDSLFGQSDCEFLRPQQQAINKIETRILQKLLRAGITPVIPEDASITLNNAVFGQVVRLKPGESMNQYGVIDNSPDISKDIAEAERLYEHAKRIIGISDSFQGQYDASAKSGVAKQAQINQAAGRLDSKRKMKNTAYSDIFSIVFELYLAYADEPRPAAYRDAYGKIQEMSFNRYDFFERDEAGEWYLDSTYLFSADASADTNLSREALWQENRLNFQQGAYGDPVLPESQLTYWLNNERLHYPFAHDNVERLREIIDTQRMLQKQQQLIAKQGASLEKSKRVIESERGKNKQLKELTAKQTKIMADEQKIIENIRNGG